MQKKTRSLLQELNEYADKKDSEVAIEARASHIIDSAINLISLLRESFEPEVAYELERRFINSIKNADSSKFTKGIRKLRKNRETRQSLRVINGDLKDDD